MKTITTKRLALSRAFLVSACGGGSQQTTADAAPAAAERTAPTKKTGKFDVTRHSVTVGKQVGSMGLVPAATGGGTLP